VQVNSEHLKALCEQVSTEQGHRKLIRLIGEINALLDEKRGRILNSFDKLAKYRNDRRNDGQLKYDISRQKSDSTLVWIESAESFEKVQERATEIVILNSWQYVIECSKNGERRIIPWEALPDNL
jgi:hypothetical protein